MWRVLLLLAALLTLFRSLNAQENSCGLSRTQITALVDEETRTWILTDDSVRDPGIQAIVDCTEEGDTISFRTQDIIQPQSRIAIPHTLTIQSSADETRDDSRSTIMCPANEGLFVLRAAGLELKNVVISGCDLTEEDQVAGIIRTGTCPSDEDGRSGQMTLQLQKVDFTSNRNLGGSLISVRDPSCYRVDMRDVLFHSNQYATQSELSSLNEMRNVSLSENGNTSLFYLPPDSSTTVARTSAEDNAGTLFEVDQALMDIVNSEFLRNFAFQKGVIFAVASNVSISGTSFGANRYEPVDVNNGPLSSAGSINGNASGSIITLNDPRTVEISNCIFEATIAEQSSEYFGSGVLEINGEETSSKTSSIKILDSIFLNNSAFKSGGIVLNSVRQSEILISNSTFEKNRARWFFGGGALSVFDLFADCNLQIVASRFESNTAQGFGGAITVNSSSGNVTFQDSEFRANKANSFGGAISFNASSGSVTFEDSRFEANKAKIFGGAVSIYYSSDSVTFLHSEFRENEAESFGGAISVGRSSGAVTFEDSKFLTNKAKSSGGAVSIFSSSTNMSFRDSQFTSNEAESFGGGINIGSSSGAVTFEDSKFEVNKAKLSGGATSMSNSSTNMTFIHSEFKANEAESFAGGINVLSSSGNLQFLNSEFKANEANASGGAINFDSSSGTVTFEDSKFEVNNARFFGGAMGIASSTTSVLFLNCEFQENKAGSGGAVRIDSSSTNMTVLQSEFVANNAVYFGGAIYIYSSSGSSTFQRSKFMQNEAERLGGGAVYGEDSENFSFGNCTFEENIGYREGGAILLIDCEKVAIENCIFYGNRAILGGATGFKRSSATVNSTSLIQNHAVSGGGLYSSLGELQIENCMFESNIGEFYGGGIHAIAGDEGRIELQSSNVLVNNIAIIGGGAFFQLDQGYRLLAYRPVAIHPSVVFESNNAFGAGGAFYIDYIDGLDDGLNCSYPLDSITPFSTDEGLNQIKIECSIMKNNTVDKEGYGPNIATAAISFYLTVLDEEKKDYIVGDVVNISGHKSGDPLPVFKVTTYDYFNQGPAITKTRSVFDTYVGIVLLDYTAFAKATIASLDANSPSLLPNFLVTDVSTGTGRIAVGSPLQKPGTYALALWIAEDLSAYIEIDVTLRSCNVNEAPVQQGMLCEECDPNHYNFDPENGTCETCPDNCQCSAWGIIPTDKHWLSAPCSTDVMDCLSNTACSYDGREEKLISFFETLDPTCELDEDEIERFHELQCREGHEGLLCSTCSEGYGGQQSECAECQRYALVVLSLLGQIFWNFFVSASAIAGNLPHSPCRKLKRQTHGRQISRNYPSLENGEKLENINEDRAACEIAKLNITESFKIFLNFAQVCSIALALGADYTKLLTSALESLDFVGAATGEMTLSLDCLFSASASVPRSVNRVVLSLLVPLVVLSLLSVYWLIILRNDKPVLKRRLILSTVVVFYVSYIGWVETLLSALNCVRISNGFFSDLYWTEDTSVRCFEGSHLVLVCALVAPMIVVVMLGFPIGSAVYLYQKKRADCLENEIVKETYGFMYAVYNERSVYWECIILLKKASLALIIVFGVGLGSNMQALISSCVLIFCLYFHAKFLPYSQDFASLNSMEVLSLLVCAVVFLYGPILEDDRITQGGRLAASVFAVALMSGFVLYFLYDLYRKISYFCRSSLRSDLQTVRNKDTGFSVIAEWMKYRYRKASFRIGQALENSDSRRDSGPPVEESRNDTP